MRLDLFTPENTDPYLLPDDGVANVINFSGGRTSAFMLYKFLYRYEGRLPAGTHVCFANTGAEADETLYFVQECSSRWGVPVVWLEYRWDPTALGGRHYPRHFHKVVSWATASRNYEPYDMAIEAKAMLPNVATRFCTTQLKVNPIRWYLRRELGITGKFRNILGIRHDEKKRWGRAIFKECWSEYPLVHDGVLVRDVMEFWSKQPFDLGIDSDEGNCDLCFLKGAAKLVRLIRKNPEKAKWWMEWEEKVAKLATGKGREPLRNESKGQFSQRHRYRDLLDMALKGVNPDGPPEDVDCVCDIGG